MVEARRTRDPLPRARTLATVAVVGLATVGCTMCPDPFDYSGPVPNGSAPQNDFRARSGGILPLGAAPRPWPLIVQSGGRSSDEERAPAERAAADVDAADGEELHQTVAVVVETEEIKTAETPADVAPVSVETAVQAAVEVAPPERLGPPAAVVVPLVPAGETPGWRARRP